MVIPPFLLLSFVYIYKTRNIQGNKSNNSKEVKGIDCEIDVCFFVPYTLYSSFFVSKNRHHREVKKKKKDLEQPNAKSLSHAKLDVNQRAFVSQLQLVNVMILRSLIGGACQCH